VAELSRFFGIVVGMFFNEHNPPHFHVVYGSFRAAVEIESGAFRGEFPRRAKTLVLEWLEIHRAELLERWSRAQERKSLEKIAPLE
jgi:hypothetical protein